MKKIISLSLVAVVCLCLFACNKASRPSANTLRLVSESKIRTLDPAMAEDTYSQREVGRSYEGLLQYHYLKRPFQLIPNLAKQMPSISADGKLISIELTPGVRFHNDPCFPNAEGRELTADDVIYSFKRLADPKLNPPGWWILDGKIEGLNEWRSAQSKASGVDYNTEIPGLKKLDKYKLEIRLKEPSAQFLYALAMPNAFIVPREGVEKYGAAFEQHPVGTGPFMLKNFDRGLKVEWIRNPKYRTVYYPSEGAPEDLSLGLLGDAGMTIPFLDSITVTAIEEDQPRWLSFMSGATDIAGIPKDNFAAAVEGGKLRPELAAKNIRLLVNAQLDIIHFTFNFANPLLAKNKKLRQAMSLAFDDAKLIETFYNGRALTAKLPTPPALSDYAQNPELPNPWRRFDLTAAKAKLAEAGYPEGKGLPELEFTTPSTTVDRQVAEFFQKNMAELGIKIKITAMSWAEYSAAINAKKGDIWYLAWSADYPDAENFFALFYSKNASPGPNDANYNNPAFDKLYENLRRELNPGKAQQLKRQMAEIIVEDCPWIMGIHRLAYTVLHSRVKNFKPNDVDMTRYKYFRTTAE